MSLAHRRLPFGEQINYFRAKLNLPTQSYADIYGAEHDAAFVVAGMARMDMLADMRKAVDKAIADGTTLDAFRKDFDSIVARYGWQYNGGRDWRSRIIYNTNLYSSYQAGRYEQQQEMKQLRPYWEYRHRDGQKHPRPEHEAWDGLVLHCDDPWWQTHYPINAYGCKCTVFAHSERSLARNGLKVGKAPPVEMHTVVVGKNSANPRIVAVPKGIDPGFDHVPGKARDSMMQRLFDKASNVPPMLAAKAVDATLSHPQVRRLLNTEVATMVDAVFAEMAKDDPRKKARGIQKSVGVLHEATIAGLQKRGFALSNVVITLVDKDIMHAVRDNKNLPISQETWRAMADLLANPQAVLIDESSTPPTLLYYCEYGEDKNKIVLKLEDKGKARDPDTGKSRTIRINHVRSATVLETEEQITSLKAFPPLWGKIP